MMRLSHTGLHGRCTALLQRRCHSSHRAVRVHAWEDEYSHALSAPLDTFQEEDPMKVAMRAIFEMPDEEEDEGSDSEGEDMSEAEREKRDNLLDRLKFERVLLEAQGLNVSSIYRKNWNIYGAQRFADAYEEAGTEAWTENWEQQFRETPSNGDEALHMGQSETTERWWAAPEPEQAITNSIEFDHIEARKSDRQKAEARALELHDYHLATADSEFDYTNRLAEMLTYVEDLDRDLDDSLHFEVQTAPRADLPLWVRAQYYVACGFDQWNEDHINGRREREEWIQKYYMREKLVDFEEDIEDMGPGSDYFEELKKEKLLIDAQPQPQIAQEGADGVGEDLDEFMHIDVFAGLLPAKRQAHKQLQTSELPDEG